MTTIEQNETVSPAAVEAFAGRVVGVLNDACTALMLSIGHQTGLLDTLAENGPATSQETADAAGLDERYVRECLNALTVAGMVGYEPGDRRYRLPPEHAAVLTRAAGPDNLARAMTFVPMLAEVEQGIVECFRSGGGLPYSAYPRFHALMAEDSRAMMDAALVSDIVPLVDGLTERLVAGIDVCDVGCGSGHAVNVLAQAFPRSRVTGLDFSAQAIETARAEARELGLDNARFEVVDVATLAEEATYDLVTAFDAVHDQAQPATVLANVARALRPDGVFLMADIHAASDVADNLDHPGGPFLYAVSTMHCMSVSLGLDGAGLGTMWGEQLATSMLHDAGFGRVSVHQLPHDPFNDFYVCRPG
jgi:SAM-dependent methyltransferase